MAYNNYFPQSFYQNPQPYYGMGQNPPQMVQNGTPNVSSGINWVLGEAAAKSFPVGSGQTVLLMDREEPVIYIKATDPNGVPQPLRIYDIKERVPQSVDSGNEKKPNVDYVSRQEFEEFREDVKRSIKGIRKPKIEEDEE